MLGAMKNLSFTQRIAVLLALLASMVAALALYGPIPQDPALHAFADRRSWFGIANFSDVASNAGFVLAGLLGLWVVRVLKAREADGASATLTAFNVYFAAVILVGAGSAWYHLAPDNGRLVWDRLPIAVALMAWFCGVIADRVEGGRWIGWLLPALTLFGALSVFYWGWTQSQGHGDLRLYAIAQYYPVLALPFLCGLFPNASKTAGGYLVWIYLWFALSKALEHFDVEIFALSGNAVSGHTLKHIALVIAALVVVRMLQRNANLNSLQA